jgi:Chaperone of endosialidase
MTGLKNTAVGASALVNSNGSKNIAIGFNAGLTLTSGNNNIYLGSPGAGDESLTMRLGNVQTSAFIAGINTATVSDAAVMIDTTTGQLGIATSSARYKQDITPMGSRSEKVLDLRPVTFAYKDDARGVTHYGLIAEEVAAVYPDLVTHTATGEVQAVKYQELIPILLNELQRQHQALQSQQKELSELRALVGQGRGKVVLAGTGE